MPSYRVPEMSCGHCKAAIEKAVARVDKEAKISVDLEAKTVVIESRLAAPGFRAAIEQAGYQVESLD